jgi:hypothetical protein
MPEPARLQLVPDDSAASPAVDVSNPWAPRHDVQFYENEDFLYSAVGSFLADGVRAGQPLIVVATAPHRTALADRLRSLGMDIDHLTHGRDVVWLDARETLSAFMEGPTPNRELFNATVGNVFDKMMTGRKYVVLRAYGEMVDLLWKDGNIEGAIALEELWNDLAVKYSFSLLCAYAIGNFFKEAHTYSFKQICRQHGRVIPTETYILADEANRLREITLLQQRARALDAEVEHRQELEVALRDVLAQRRALEETLRQTQS